MPLTKFVVTGRYQVRPCILKKNFITQQSSWMEMALEISGSMATLESGVGRRLKIAAAALGGGDGRRTCNNGVGIEVGVHVVKAEGSLLQQWHQRWQGWQERTHPMQGT
jgi:hypothetical protein